MKGHRTGIALRSSRVTHWYYLPLARLGPAKFLGSLRYRSHSFPSSTNPIGWLDQGLGTGFEIFFKDKVTWELDEGKAKMIYQWEEPGIQRRKKKRKVRGIYFFEVRKEASTPPQS